MFELKSIYFNSAYLGPTPVRAKKKIEAMLQQSMDPAFFEFNFQYSDRVRALFAGLAGCAPENIAVGSSVSELVSHVANGLQLGPDDEVILLDGEYPSMVLPWMVLSKMRGFKIRYLDLSYFLEPARLKPELRAKTKYVGVSHVMFNTGARLPVADIGRVCREAGPLFLTDVSQSFGGMPLPDGAIENIDIIVGVGYKWLLGPYGSGFGYFSARALERVERTHASWLNSPNAARRENLLRHTTESLPGARKFDRGQAPSFLICAGLEGSLELLQETGLPAIARHNRSLVDLFFEHLPVSYEVSAPRELRSNIVCVKPSQRDPTSVKALLAKQNIDVSVREDFLRISFHFFNTVTQVEKLLLALNA